METSDATTEIHDGRSGPRTKAAWRATPSQRADLRLGRSPCSRRRWAASATARRAGVADLHPPGLARDVGDADGDDVALRRSRPGAVRAADGPRVRRRCELRDDHRAPPARGPTRPQPEGAHADALAALPG